MPSVKGKLELKGFQNLLGRTEQNADMNVHLLTADFSYCTDCSAGWL